MTQDIEYNLYVEMDMLINMYPILLRSMEAALATYLHTGTREDFKEFMDASHAYRSNVDQVVLLNRIIGG